RTWRMLTLAGRTRGRRLQPDEHEVPLWRGVANRFKISVMADSNEAQKTSLLLIDDDKKLCRLIKDYLEPLGYEVVAAHTGKEGLEKALAGKFDAVILDIMMPEMDGLEVLRRLRAASSVPVLMLTGLGEEPDRIVGLEMGADDYLPKTYSTRELLARLRAVI